MASLVLAAGLSLSLVLETRGREAALREKAEGLAQLLAGGIDPAAEDERAGELFGDVEGVPGLEGVWVHRGARLVAAWQRRAVLPSVPNLEGAETAHSGGLVFAARSLELGGEPARLTVAFEDGGLPSGRLTQQLLLFVLLIGCSVLPVAWLLRRAGAPLRTWNQIIGHALEVDDFKEHLPEPSGTGELARLGRGINGLFERLERGSDEKRTVQTALQRTERRFRTLIEASRNAVYVVVGWRLVYVNPQFEQVFGRTREEMLDAAFDLRELVTAESRTLLPSVAEISGVLGVPGAEEPASGPELQIGELPLVYEIQGLTKDGERIDFEVGLSPVEWDGLQAVMGVLHNITDRKVAELEREQDLLRRSNEELERYAQALESSNEQLEQFAYVASHDLQEPLRTVSSYVQLLARRYRGQLDSDADDFIDFAVDGAKRMKELIDGLLVYSRVGNQGTFTQVSCEDIMESTVRSLRRTLEDTGAEIVYDSLPVLLTDGRMLAQLFQNLISNGIKFRGEEPPRIEVQAERTEVGWHFTVRDNGMGIEPEFQGKIFHLFQRLHTRDQYAGHGIGLAICKRIIERHHGQIWVESTFGEGSTFHFTIPELGREMMLRLTSRSARRGEVR